jgi:hypothetical protein
MSAEWSTLDSLPHSSLAQKYVSDVIQKSLELPVTVICDPELDLYMLYVILKQNWLMSSELSTLLAFLKQTWFISAEWITLDSLPHSSLAQRYVSGVIQTSLELTDTVKCDPELDLYMLYVILKQNWLMSAEWTTILFFLIQNWFMSAEWSTLDSLPHSSLA